VVKAAVA